MELQKKSFLGGLKSDFKEHKEEVSVAVNMAWPAVMESFFVALAGMIDSLMVSTIGAYAVAAVGLTTQPKFVGLAIFIATNVSVSAIVARRRGEQDRKGANQVLLMAMVFVLLMGTVISICFVKFAEPLMHLAGSGEDTHEAAVLYFRIIMGGMMFNILSLVINAAQRGAGNTKIAMRTNITSNVVNMIGNYILINGHLGFPAMGIKGAALATVFGTVIACGMSFWSIMDRDNFVSLPYIFSEHIRPSLEAAKSMVKISSSVFLEQILLRVGFMSVSIMTAKLGTQAFAAHQVGMNVMSLSFSFGDGMQVAAVALIGRSLGQKNPELAKTYGRLCRYMGGMISVCLSLCYLLFGRFLYHLYFTEPDIIAMGVTIMRVMVLVVLLQVGQVIYMGCLRGAGDIAFTTMASTISVTFVRPIMSYVCCYVLGIGLIGIWMGIICDQLCRYIMTSIRFKSGKWVNIKI